MTERVLTSQERLAAAMAALRVSMRELEGGKQQKERPRLVLIQGGRDA